MSRPRGSIIGAKPTWTTTATSGIWSLRQAEEMKAANQWPRGPEAPTSLAGTAGDEEVALTWTAPATTHGTITDYIVEYTPAAGSPTVVATGSTAASYTLTGLTNDTEYMFRVAAVNHTRGDWSSSLALTPAEAPSDPEFASVSLLLHMDGSNGSTTFTDSGPNGVAVTANNGAAISTADSKYGGAGAYFNGDTQSLSFADPGLGTGDFTVEMWFKTNSSVQYAQLIGNESAGLAGFTLLINNDSETGGEMAVYRGGGLVLYSSSGDWSDNAWHHVALTRSGTSVKLWIDGTEYGSGTDGTSYSGSTWYVGRNEVYSPRDFVGYIDDLRITAGVARYTAAFTPPTAAFPDA
jgi:hypothetical protein